MPFQIPDRLRFPIWIIEKADGAIFGSAVAPRSGFDLGQRIESLSFKHDADKSAVIRITMENEDLMYFEDPVMQKGERFLLTFGYEGDLSEIYLSQISSFKGFTRVTIEAEVVEESFSFEQKTKNWQFKTFQQIVERIAIDNGFKKVILEKDLKVRLQLPFPGTQQQQKMTDKEFLIALGEEWGLTLTTLQIEGVMTLFLVKQNLGGIPIETFEWRNGVGLLKAFEITENSLLGIPQEIVVEAYDSIKRKMVKGEAGAGKTGRKNNTGAVSERNYTRAITSDSGKFVRLANRGAQKQKKGKEIVIGRATSKAEAQIKADALYQALQDEQLTATATVIGNPALIVNQLISISGVPTMLAGNYMIRKVEHKFSSGGYETIMELNRDALSFVPTTGANAAAASGKTNKKKPSDKLVEIGFVDEESGKKFKMYKRASSPLMQRHPQLMGE